MLKLDFRRAEILFFGFKGLLIACFLYLNVFGLFYIVLYLCMFLCFFSNLDYLLALFLGGLSSSSGSSEEGY